MFNRLRLLKIRHHLLWEFVVYWCSAWAMLISGVALTIYLFNTRVDGGCYFLMFLVILPTIYWYWELTRKSIISLARWVKCIYLQRINI